MKSIGLAVSLLIGSAAIAAEVVSPPPAPMVQPAKPANEAEAKQAVDPLSAAYRSNDAARFIALLPEELRQEFGPTQFTASYQFLLNNFGKPEAITFLTRLRNPMMLVLLWKVEYRRETPDGGSTVQDGLLSATFVKTDQVFRLTSFRFL